MVARQSDKCRSIFRFSPILYGKKHMGIATRAYRDSRATHVPKSSSVGMNPKPVPNSSQTRPKVLVLEKSYSQHLTEFCLCECAIFRKIIFSTFRRRFTVQLVVAVQCRSLTCCWYRSIRRVVSRSHAVFLSCASVNSLALSSTRRRAAAM